MERVSLKGFLLLRQTERSLAKLTKHVITVKTANITIETWTQWP